MAAPTTYTIATLPRITASTLSSLILSSSPSSTSNPNTSDAVQPEEKAIAPGGGGGTGPSALEKIAIIDVRDDDHIGGHIRHSTHVPSSTLDYAIPSLVHKLKNKETVVFHCALSQQRGPSAALRYLRERERLLGAVAEGEGVGVGQKVLVLDRGFVGWQELYGEDVRLTEGFRREIWEEGY